MRSKLKVFLLALTLVLIGAKTAQAGLFSRLVELEQRKNAWLRSVFLRR
jgi:hypothetical protein